MSVRLFLLSSALVLAACATAQENPNYQHSTKYGTTQTASTVYTVPATTQTASHDGRIVQSSDGYVDGSRTLSAGTQTGLTHTHPMASGHSLSPAHAVETNHTNAGYVGSEGAMIPAAHPGHQNAPSPTESAYDSGQMQGTPGYEMMRAQQHADDAYPVAPAPTYPSGPATDYVPYVPPAIAQASAPAPRVLAPAPAPTGPRQVAYDYNDNVSGAVPSTRQTVPNYSDINAQRTGTAANIATGQSYVVRQGDTIYSLSRRLCTPISELTTPNGIGGDFAISIGQTLTLPNTRC